MLSKILAVLLGIGLVLTGAQAVPDGLGPESLGVVFNRDDPASVRVALYYSERRHIPARNLVGLAIPDRSRINREELAALRTVMLQELPSSVQSLLLVWQKTYAVECMSVTTAFAAGYQPRFCEPGCQRTALSALFDARGWLPADTVGWLPAMLLPSGDETLAKAVINRGIAADGTRPAGTVYLVRTPDVARNVRAAGYSDTESLISSRVLVREAVTPVQKPLTDILAYFTGIARVEELPKLSFRPGAVADHLTSSGGALGDTDQMSSLEWLRQGVTASYGAVSEPCNHPGKFPSPAVFMDHYLRGETVLEAYWKSVAMPGQGLFIGEPLARPFGAAAGPR